VELAERYNGVAKDIRALENALAETDILISSTGAKDFVITASTVQRAVKKRKGKPLFIVDIAVPRDVDPSIQELEGVFLYDIDDLEGIVQTNLEERKEAAARISEMIEEQVGRFFEWVGTLGVVPIIAGLRQKALQIQSETMKSLERKLPDLTERERKIISKHTKSIVNQMLREPIQKAKEFAVDPDAKQLLNTFIDIFGLDLELSEDMPYDEQRGYGKRPVLNEARPRS